MHFHIVTLFPNSFDSYLGESILKRAIEDKKLKVSFYNPRDFAPQNTEGKAVRIDKPPYAGGPGMVIQAEPVIKAIEAALKKVKKVTPPNPPLTVRGGQTRSAGGVKIIFLSPGGKQFTNEYAKKTAKKYKDVIIVSGRYEGIDARIKKVFSAGWRMEDVSIGPFVLTGGELPALLIVDVMARQVEGVLGNFDSLEESRVSTHDVYTRPEVFTHKGKKYRVPKILLSGDHKKIEEWKVKGKKAIS